MAYHYDRTRTADGIGNGKETLGSFFNGITYKGHKAIVDLDEKLVGTPDYMGIAYFWNDAYKFTMRPATTAKRRAVHKEFLKAKLPLAGESPEHEAIVKKLVGL